PRVDPRLSRIGPDKGKGTDLEPLGADEALDYAGGKVVLVKGIGDRQRLPPIHVNDVAIPSQAGNQRWIYRRVAASGGGNILVRACLIGAVVEKISGNRFINAVAQAGRSGSVSGNIISVVAERGHQGVERRERVCPVNRVRVSFFKQAVGG